ncbi:helicase-related protein [Vibrio cincinnatiensis]|uniref:helicase-related protein n=1 Tax=Vibrio cincinnatiensis TaxID=675 RepID=UPI0038AEBF42
MPHLPIQSLYSDFLSTLPHQHLVVEAQTGSGKSTCLPLWAAQQGRVLVIEPRRIACTSLAQFLAEQHSESVGQTVGYAIKLESCYNEQSQIVFVTPGVALRWLAEEGLATFDIVIIDEFHERRWDSDLLLALLREQANKRLVVTSATLEGERAHYLNAKRLQADGRQYEVVIEYHSKESHQLPASYRLAERVVHEVRHAREHTPADILVFLPGRKEISQCQQLLAGQSSLLVVPLHASVSEQDRHRALNPQPQQKVVLATNVAETSLTIPNIAYVIDSGLERRTEQRNGRTTLTLKAISKASAQQRAGRAGRVMNGVAVRLYGQHAALEAVTPAEMQRESLLEPMLASASCGRPITQLTFLESLPEKSLQQAFEQLVTMQAISENGVITEHGQKIAPLPIDALYADLVARMAEKSLQEAMIDLTAALSVPASLYTLLPSEEQREKLNQQEPLRCDAQLLIQLVRGTVFEGISIETEALHEAQGLAEQMRQIYQLPQLEVASRYSHQQLAYAIARIHPELLFVRRVRRKEAMGNGKMEVLIGRNSRFSTEHEAALVLDHHSLPGRGIKQTMTLATVMMPIEQQAIEHLDLGEWRQAETESQDGTLLTVLKLYYAGREIAQKQVQAEGELAVKSLLDMVTSEQCFPGFAKQRQQEILLWKLYVDLGLDSATHEHHSITFEQWFTDQLTQLGIHSLAELELFSADDFPFEGIPYWEKANFSERYPFELYLGDLQLSVEYHPKRKWIYVIYQSGLRKSVPKRWELPRWEGYRIQFKKASRVIDIY